MERVPAPTESENPRKDADVTPITAPGIALVARVSRICSGKWETGEEV
jgi:hypothetical protein